MRTVQQYPLAVTAEQTVFVPGGSEPLSVQFQGDALWLWMVVDTEVPVYRQTIRLFDTDAPLPEGVTGYFVGTVQKQGLPSGVWHAWHVFFDDSEFMA